MANSKWAPELEIGIPFVDADHKVLVNLLDQTETCINQNEETTLLGSMLSALAEYVSYHFAREEKLFEGCGYDGADFHIKIHRDLEAEVLLLCRRFEDDPQSVEVGEVHDFLHDWLVEHIVGHDFAFRGACIGNEDAIAAAAAMPFFTGGGDGAGTLPEWDSLRVLVVDDNPNMLNIVETILRIGGVKNIELTASAAEGLALLVKRPADVVLCDWVMEDMNGAEFARRAAAMESGAKVVLLTGYSVDVVRQRSAGAGISGYLEKPITAAGLLEMMAGLSPPRIA
jgi:hemerythrin-like metal-binding protein